MEHPPPSDLSGPAATAFSALFDDVHDDLVRFCARRTDTASAEDVAADALLTAWRRFDDAPLSHDGRRAWVYGIARNQLLNAARSAGRRGALAVRMTKTAPLPSGVTEDEAVLRADLSAAWARLTPPQQEVWVSQNGSDRIPSTVVLTERRGDWVLALLTTSKGPVTCLHDQRWHREASGGLAGPMALPAPPSSTGIVLTRAGASARDDGDPIVREVAGRVLPDVTRVVVHTAARGDVTATVVDGWVVAWWPGEPMGSDVKDADGSLSDGFDRVTVSRRGAGSTTYPAASLLVRN